MRRAVFLDRDGTLNYDPGYIHDPDVLRLFPDVGAALQQFRRAGFLLIVVTNQSGIARGKITPLQLQAVHARLDVLLDPWAACPDAYFICMHHPDEHCKCRKPSPFLILQAAKDFSIDCTRSLMIGDRMTDCEAGVRAGCRSYLIREPGASFATLQDAANALC